MTRPVRMEDVQRIALDELEEYHRQTAEEEYTDVGILWEICLRVLHAFGRFPEEDHE